MHLPSETTIWDPVKSRYRRTNKMFKINDKKNISLDERQHFSHETFEVASKMRVLSGFIWSMQNSIILVNYNSIDILHKVIHHVLKDGR